jgi:hypothetical protein
MDHDLVPDGLAGHVRTDRPYDPRGVAAPDVEVVGLAEPGVDLGDVDRDALRRPHVVVVDARRHHQHERLAGPRPWRFDGFDLEC